MATIEQLQSYLNQITAEDSLSGNQVGLRHARLAVEALTSVTSPEQLLAHLEQQIAAQVTAADRPGLRDTQSAAGVLAKAAEENADRTLAQRLRVLAARAADAFEELSNA